MTTFVDIIDREKTLIIDGYSSAKTINGVMHDIARLMKKVLPNEYDTFMTANKEEAENLLACTPKSSEGGFFVEVEDASCACKYNEDIDELQYKDGYNYYFCTRVVK